MATSKDAGTPQAVEFKIARLYQSGQLKETGEFGTHNWRKMQHPANLIFCVRKTKLLKLEPNAKITLWQFKNATANLGEEDDFDVAFWQSQPPEVLFEAASQLIKDYLLIKKGYADEPRFQRTVECFQKT